MIHIEVADVHKAFGGQSVLSGLSFSVVAGEHVGLVGPNGSGKTTLLRLLTGEEAPDAGGISLAPGLRTGLLSQLPQYPEGTTAEEVLRCAFADINAAENELRELESRISAGEQDALRRYGELSHKFEFLGGFDAEVELARICNGLRLDADMLTRDMKSLSGGEQTRVNLGRLLLMRTDLLLLDEPTNHLDLSSCEWLESYLGTYKGTVLAVSHDRYFLDNFAKRIIELSDGRAEFYSGNYSFYAAEREARFLEKQRRYDKERREYQKLADAARQMHAWAGQNQKLHRRAFAMEKRAERIIKTDKPTAKRAFKSGFRTAQFDADDVFRIENLRKSFGEHVIFSDLTLSMRNGERVALLGDNGAGKSTLIKLLIKELVPDAGEIWTGPAVRCGYLPQNVTHEHPERNLVDTLLYGLDITPAEARNRLAAFGFTGEKVFDRVGALSGGESSRLRLCLLMARGANLLLLDEPTNHLDIDSRVWVESALESYEQAILFVSHDRYFIERFAQRILWLEDGEVWDFHGEYKAFRRALEEKRQESAAKPREAEERKKSGNNGKSPLARQRDAEREQVRTEREIERLEALLGQLETDMADAAADYERLCELTGRQSELLAEREALYERYWTLAEDASK